MKAAFHSRIFLSPFLSSITPIAAAFIFLLVHVFALESYSFSGTSFIFLCLSHLPLVHIVSLVLQGKFVGEVVNSSVKSYVVSVTDEKCWLEQYSVVLPVMCLILVECWNKFYS